MQYKYNVKLKVANKENMSACTNYSERFILYAFGCGYIVAVLCFVAVAVVAWITWVCACITCASVCIFLCVKTLDPKRVSATDNYKAHLPSSERSHQLRKKRINTTLFLSFALDPWCPAPAGNISPHLPSDQCTLTVPVSWSVNVRMQELCVCRLCLSFQTGAY